MADNVGYTPGTGATVAADEIGGVLHQRVKIGIGADGVAVDVSASNPMPITGTVSTGISQPLTDSELRASPVPVSGTVTANTGLAQAVTDSQLRATPVPVSGTFFQATQPVSIASSVPVTGPVTDAQLRATPVPISGTVTANTGLAQPLTDIEIRATPLPISGTITANTGLTQPLTDAQIRATALPVSGPLTDTQLRAASVPVSGTFFQATQPVSAVSLPLPSGAATETTLVAVEVDASSIATSTSSINTKTPALGQTTMAGSTPVVIASNQAAIPFNLADAQLTTFSQSGAVALNTVLMTLDLLNYGGACIHVAQIGAGGTITFEASNDNTLWVSVNVIGPTGTAAVSSSAASVLIYQRYARYLRLRVSVAITSGTTNIYAERIVSSPNYWASTQAVSGTVTSSLSAGTNAIGDVGIQYRANATGAASGAHLISGASTNATVVKASVGRLIGWNFANTNAAWRYVKLHNQTTTPTAGSGVVRTIAIPPNNISQIHFEGGIAFSTGIAFTTVTGAADADAVAVGLNDIVGDLFFA